MSAPVTGTLVKSEQLVRNALYSGTRSGYAATGHHPGRWSLLVYRFALPQKERISAQFSGSRNDHVLLLHIRRSVP